MEKTSTITLYNLKRAESIGRVANKVGVLVCKAKSNKCVNFNYESGSRYKRGKDEKDFK